MICFVLASILLLGIFGLQESFAEQISETSCKYGEALQLNHSIEGGIVVGICLDIEGNSLITKINSTENGKLVLQIPINLVNGWSENCQDDSFFVLVNDMEVSHDEFKPHDIVRIITIPFQNYDSEIEVIGSGTPESLMKNELEKCIQLRVGEYSPREQIRLGQVPSHVVCKGGLELIFKHSDKSPTCVKLGTAEKLIERGWAKYDQTILFSESKSKTISVDGELYDIRYSIDGNIINKMEYFDSVLTVYIENEDDGILNISIPKNLGFWNSVVISMNNFETEKTESITESHRIFSVYFPKNTEKIEFISVSFP